MEELEKMYEEGCALRDSGDYAAAVEKFRYAAEQGHAPSQCCLGVRYANGEGVEMDKAEAVKWFKKSAEQGYAKAMHNLGNCYATGEGVEESKWESLKWFRSAQKYEKAELTCEKSKAEEVGDIEKVYEEGNELYVDGVHAWAVEKFRYAAERGHAGAQYSLGDCYLYGNGVEEDAAEAVKWYKMAAEQGHAGAQESLGDCYYEGEGVEEDAAEAEKWYQKAFLQHVEDANKGDFLAYEDVVRCYLEGKGVKKDIAKAEEWYKKAKVWKTNNILSL